MAPLSSLLALDGYQLAFGLPWGELGWLLFTQVAATFFLPIGIILVYYMRRFRTTTRAAMPGEPPTTEANWQDQPYDEEPQFPRAA